MKAKPAVVASGRFARSTVDKSDSFQGDLTRTAVKHSTAGVVLVALALAVQSVNAHADTPPKLNMVPTCDAAASYAGLADRDKTSCMTDENDALTALKKNWSQYSSPDKTDCVTIAASDLSEIGGKCDKEELIAMKTNTLFVEKETENGKKIFAVTVPIHDPSGDVIGTVGIDFARNSDAEQAKITERAKQLGTELEAKLKSKAKMFESLK